MIIATKDQLSMVYCTCCSCGNILLLLKRNMSTNIFRHEVLCSDKTFKYKILVHVLFPCLWKLELTDTGMMAMTIMS